MSELTAAAVAEPEKVWLPEYEIRRRKNCGRKKGDPLTPRKARMGLTKKQKDFCKNLIKTGGDKSRAYEMAYGKRSSQVTSNGVYAVMKNPKVIEHTNYLLEKAGMPRNFFVKKLKDLCEAKTETVLKDGSVVETKDNSTQFQSMKLGMELHGMLQKAVEGPQIQVNYNLDASNINGALEKLTELTRKLELQECPAGDVVDAEIVKQ